MITESYIPDHFIWQLWNSPKTCFINFIWNTTHVLVSISYYGAFIITLPFSQYDLNNIEMDVKHGP